MNAKITIEGAGHEPATLGSVLYARNVQPPVPESDWVGLVHAMAAGDQRALRDLYGRSHRLVFTLIMRIVRDAATAEELTVDVFHDLWRRASAYDPKNGTVLGWIMNQTRSRAIDRLRFEQRKKRSAAGGALEPVDVSGAVEDEIEPAQQGLRLRNALTSLTREERQAIENTFFAEQTYAEAAQQLAQPLGTIKTRIRSALAKLRERLATGDEAT